MKRNRFGRLGALGCVAAIGGLMALTASGTVAGATARPHATTTSLPPPIAKPSKALLAKARAEGKVVWYTALTSNLPQLAAAFTAAYPGITVEPVSLVGTILQTRYDSEASSGATQADVVTVGYSSFFSLAYHAGYLQSDANLFTHFKAHYPSQYILGDGITGVTSVIPYGFAYNNNTTSTKKPRLWTDLALPQYKGQVIAPDPNSSIAALEQWDFLIHEYGKKVVQEIAANVSHYYSSNATTLSALAAGGGQISWAGNAGQVGQLTAQGAPIRLVIPKFTTGAEFCTSVSAKSPDVAAGEVFANWLFSKAGQAALVQYEGGGSPLQPKYLPKGFTTPIFTANNDQTEIDSLLGVGPN